MGLWVSQPTRTNLRERFLEDLLDNVTAPLFVLFVAFPFLLFSMRFELCVYRSLFCGGVRDHEVRGDADEDDEKNDLQVPPFRDHSSVTFPLGTILVLTFVSFIY